MIADYDPAPEEGPDVAPAPSPLVRPPRRRRRNRVAAFALAVAGVAVSLALLAAGAGLLAINRGAVSLDALRPAIAENLQSRLPPGYKVAMGPIALSHGPRGLGLGFSGLSLTDPQGRKVVQAPGGRIGLDAFALMAMSVKVRSLALDGLELALKIDAEGKLSLSAGAETSVPIEFPQGQGPTAFDAGALVVQLAEAMAGSDQPIDHVAILDGRLTVLTAGRAAPQVYDNLRVTFDRSGSAATAGVAAQGPSGNWSLDVRADAGATRKLSVEAHTISLDDILQLQPHPPGFNFNSPISFAFATEAAPTGGLRAFAGSFSVGAGSFDPHDPDGAPPVAIDEATGKMSLATDGRIKLDRVEVLAGATHVRFGGFVTPPKTDDPQWRASLTSHDLLFAGAGAHDPPASFDDVALDAHFDPASQTFETDKFVAKGPHLSGAFGVRMHLTPDGPELKLDLSGAGALMEMLRLWPIYVNPDARKWCDENIKGGEVAAGSLAVDWDAAAFAGVMAKHAAPDQSVKGHFEVRNVAVNLLPGLPLTTGVDATGEITGRHFQVSAPRALMELSQGRRIVGADLSFVVPDTAPAPRVPANAGAHLAGGADALAELLSLEALKRFAGVAVDPNTFHGQFQGDLKLALTLGKGVQPDEQKFRATGSLTNFGVDKFLGPQKLEQGALDFTADRSGLKLSGTGQIFGAAAKLDVVKNGQDIGALTVSGTLDDAARAKNGFDKGLKLKGPVGYRLKAPLDKSGADVEVDLTRASLDSLGGPPWKAAGRPGKATFQLKQAADGVAVNAIAVDAGSFAARGTATFGSEGALKSLRLAPFRMSPGDDLKLDLDAGDRPKLTLRGANLDARGFVKAVTGGGEADTHDLDIDVRVNQAQGYNREQISNLEFVASRRNGVFASLDIRGKLGAGALQAHGGETVAVRAEDAGALARFLDIYGRMEGGTIDLSVRTTSEGARGTATIRKFYVRDEPALRRLEQASPGANNASRGASGTPTGDAGSPIKFEKLVANFARTGGRLEVKDGIIANASFGLTTQGFIDFAHDRLDLNGVFVPAYQVNNAFPSIPLLGPLLGGQNEGLFAINYRASGPTANPSVNINPLSGVTPGFLRKMFGVIDGTTPTTPGAAPQSFAPTPGR